MGLNLGLHVYDISLYINHVFCSSGIRTLIAIATYILHRLIMGKVEIDKKESVLMGIFLNFYRNFYYMFHMNYVQITESDWLPG